ncbi:type VI secretion system Vgr family protein [Noviherbaspirillum malthae]|uniref:type VI secretion system Vgr family protein n=1 Tax=Noviherbaspirillum malthae TaxID=1260987 RepID=UPI00188EAF5D|nr:type VI secretion system tip protein TssI/VgrG [Noviherbaspirillum malthae]
MPQSSAREAGMTAFCKLFLDGADRSSLFELVSLSAAEQLGRVYAFRFHVLCGQGSLQPRDYLGKSFGACLFLHDKIERRFNGVILRMGRGAVQGHRHAYWFEVQPDFALLGLRSDARIFQNKPVTDVFGAVASSVPSLDWQMKGGSLAHQPWEYCVQYGETDLQFAMRLLEQEGIYFFFEHLSNAQTKMILLDDNTVSRQLSSPMKSLGFNPHGRDAERPQDYLLEWGRANGMVSGCAVLGDFDFTRPAQACESRSAKAAGHAWDGMEHYAYPGEFDSLDEGRTYADLRMQEMHAQHAQYEGVSVSSALKIGHVIQVKGHPVADMNGDFLVTATDYRFVSHAQDAGSGGGSEVQCRFSAIPADVQFRPGRITPKSRIAGPQTAIVVGPEANEIHTDQYGRIRVMFHWDRYGKPGEDTSCWIRTVQPWANQGFGFWALPRVGAEVVVQFLDGDPDRPLVTGSVYNGQNQIPYAQPEHKTRSGMRSFSTPKGGVNDYNELRFEDSKGEEEVYVQAQKDMNIRVKADATRTVGSNDSLDVEAAQNIQVGKNRDLKVGQNQSTVIGGDRTLSVDGSESKRVAGDRMMQLGSDSVQVDGDALIGTGGSMEISTGQSYALAAQLGMAMSAQTTIDIKSGMTLALDADAGLSLRCGASFISMTPAGIFIQGPLLMLNSGGAPVTAKPARPGKPKAVKQAADAAGISIAEGPPVRPATQQPRAGSLADAARSGTPFAAAG